MKVPNITNTQQTKNRNFKAQKVFQISSSKTKTLIDIIKLDPKEDKQIITDIYSSTCASYTNKKLHPLYRNFLENLKNFAAEFITKANMEEKGINVFNKDYYIGMIKGLGMNFGYTLSNKLEFNPYHESRFSIKSNDENLQKAEVATTILSIFDDYEKNNMPKAKFISFEIGPNHYPLCINTKNITNKKLNILKKYPYLKINNKTEHIKDLTKYLYSNI